MEDVTPFVESAYNSISSSNIFDRRLKIKELKKNDGKINISYRNLLGGFSEKLDTISNEIYTELIEPSVKFDPNSKTVFSYILHQRLLISNYLIKKGFDEKSKPFLFLLFWNQS